MMFNDRDSGKIHERIASLTTISTPHEGSPFADWGLKNLPKLIPLSRELGLDIEALKDLRVEVCKEFNQRSEVMELEESLEDAIQFQTYAGRQELIGVFNLLQLPFYIIEKEEGENDGLVSVQSAKWKEKYFQSTIDKTDHLNELGWWEVNQFWALETPDELLRRIHALYAEIASRLP
jgi:triacylglycerol lipase